MKTINFYNEKILLIDLSYVIFHNFFATEKWFKQTKKITFDKESIVKDIVFIEKFKEKLKKHLISFIQS